jgi:uncharacterized phage-associated protein
MGKYNISHDKAIEAIIWLSNKQPGIDIYHIVKIIFFADKMHLNRYGRPLIGDTYIKMEYGPVPSAIKDLITRDMWLSPRQIEKISTAINIDRNNHYSATPNRDADLSYFSKSDLNCLSESFENYKNSTFDELYTITHQERCYIEADEKGPIDYTLMVDLDNPNRDAIINHISETSQYIQM